MKRNKTGSKVASSARSHIEDLLDEALEETFPASDSVAVDRIEQKLMPTPDNQIRVKRAGKTPRGADGTRNDMKNVNLKRAYEPATRSDGTRILIDRLWPRGIKKEDAKIDEWAKDISPTTELRRWFGHDPARWSEFRRRYKAELRRHPKEIERLRTLARKGPLTLVFAAHDEVHNDAVVVKEVLVGRRRRKLRLQADV